MSYDRQPMTPEQDSFYKIVRSAGGRTIRLIAAKLERRFAPPPPLPAGDPAPQVTASDGQSDLSGADIYEKLYETHARIEGDETVVGDLALGRIEVEILQDAGLKPNHTLLDLGCGIGRLGCEIIPYLDASGGYIGTDISDSMLRGAERRRAELVPDPACPVRWIKQVGNSFPLEDDSVDMICAFSVFTHIEHEDAYALLTDGRRIIRPGGCFVFSCLPMDLSDARFHFWGSAQMDVTRRWSTVRNVTTSINFMNAISHMAGWEPETWIPGNRERFGQSVCVLRPLPDEVLAARENPWEL